MVRSWASLFFFFNDTATTEIYTLSRHDAQVSRDAGYVRPRDARAHRRVRGPVDDEPDLARAHDRDRPAAGRGREGARRHRSDDPGLGRGLGPAQVHALLGL